MGSEMCIRDSGDTAREAALAGQGVIWQPAFLVGEDLREGRLVPLLPGYHVPDTDVLAVYPSRRHLSAKVRVMVDFLAEAFKAGPAWYVPPEAAAAAPARRRRVK